MCSMSSKDMGKEHCKYASYTNMSFIYLFEWVICKQSNNTELKFKYILGKSSLSILGTGSSNLGEV